MHASPTAPTGSVEVPYLRRVAPGHGAPEALGCDVSQDFVQSRGAGRGVQADFVESRDGRVQVAVGVDVKLRDNLRIIRERHGYISWHKLGLIRNKRKRTDLLNAGKKTKTL